MRPENPRHFCANRDGVTAIEFALIAPVLLAFIFGMIDVGRTLWTQAALDNAVSEAARCAALGSAACASDDDVKTFAAAQAMGISTEASTFSAGADPCGYKVSAKYALPMTLPWTGRDALTITAEACFPQAA